MISCIDRKNRPFCNVENFLNMSKNDVSYQSGSRFIKIGSQLTSFEKIITSFSETSIPQIYTYESLFLGFSKEDLLIFL